MITVGQCIRAFMIAGVLALSASVAWGQSVQREETRASQDGASHYAAGMPAASEYSAAGQKLGMMRDAAADAELNALVADMNMFVGELKIETIARLLTLLVERQSTMRQQMMGMHHWMMRMMPPGEDPSPEGQFSAVPTEEVEPDSMCIERRF